VFVTGSSTNAHGDFDYATIAYSRWPSQTHQAPPRHGRHGLPGPASLSAAAPGTGSWACWWSWPGCCPPGCCESREGVWAARSSRTFVTRSQLRCPGETARTRAWPVPMCA